MRSQVFFHPATLVPSELEYAECYRARMNVVWSKMRPITNNQQKSHMQHTPTHAPQSHQQQKLNTSPEHPKPTIKPEQKTSKTKTKKVKSVKPKQKSNQSETKQ